MSIIDDEYVLFCIYYGIWLYIRIGFIDEFNKFNAKLLVCIWSAIVAKSKKLGCVYIEVYPIPKIPIMPFGKFNPDTWSANIILLETLILVFTKLT